mmetsp:Transcript_75079/g.140053  ORF Transcript_75079/g.140053 Transcript_75079/m.140053 type:complete len:166 (-) Transcript_75079:35-532(-)
MRPHMALLRRLLQLSPWLAGVAFAVLVHSWQQQELSAQSASTFTSATARLQRIHTPVRYVVARRAQDRAGEKDFVQLVLWDNNRHSFEQVIRAIRSVCRLPQAEVEKAVAKCHHGNWAVLGQFSRQTAGLYRSRLQRLGIRTTLEPTRRLGSRYVVGIQRDKDIE